MAEKVHDEVKKMEWKRKYGKQIFVQNIKILA